MKIKELNEQLEKLMEKDLSDKSSYIRKLQKLISNKFKNYAYDADVFDKKTKTYKLEKDYFTLMVDENNFLKPATTTLSVKYGVDQLSIYYDTIRKDCNFTDAPDTDNKFRVTIEAEKTESFKTNLKHPEYYRWYGYRFYDSVKKVMQRHKNDIIDHNDCTDPWIITSFTVFCDYENEQKFEETSQKILDLIEEIIQQYNEETANAIKLGELNEKFTTFLKEQHCNSGDEWYFSEHEQRLYLEQVSEVQIDGVIEEGADITIDINEDGTYLLTVIGDDDFYEKRFTTKEYLIDWLADRGVENPAEPLWNELQNKNSK